MTSGPLEVPAASPARTRTLLALFAVLLAGIFASLQISTWPTRLRYPGEQNDEGIAFFETLHLRRGIPIYALPSPGRFDGSVYGPLYYLLGAQLIDSEQPAYFPLRALSAMGMLGCAACSSLLAFRLSGRRCAAVLAPLVFLSYGSVTRFGTSARCDVVAVFLVFVGFLVAYRHFDRRTLFLAIPLMLLGLFYKQQYVAGPLAVMAALVLERRYRRAAQFAALLGLGGLAMLGIFQFVVFPGQSFLSHFALYNAAGLSWIHFKYVGLMYLGIVLLVPILLGLEYLRAGRSKILLCYLSLSVLIGMLTASRVGSDSNYWFESVLVASGLVAAKVAEGCDDPRKSPEVLVLLGIALFFAGFFNPPGPVSADFAADRAIQEYLRRTFPRGTPALSHYAGDLGRAGLELPISNFDQYRYLVAQGRFSTQELVGQLECRRYRVIVLNFELQLPSSPSRGKPDLPAPWDRAILANYKLVADLEMPGPEKVVVDDRFYVWVPRASAAMPNGQPNR